MAKEKPPKTKIGKCSGCKAKAVKVTFDACPFQADVNNDHTKVWLCDACINLRKDEI